MLRPPHDKIHVSFPGFSRLKIHIFFLKTQCSLCTENLLQKIKQRQTRSNYTGHLNTPLHSLQKEGSSAQLGVALGKKYIYCTSWLCSPECIPERSLLPCCINVLNWAGKNTVAGLLLLLQSKCQWGAVPRSCRGLILCPKV